MDEAISRRKILITCGTGGVGKTTVSAAIAIRAALRGRKVAVITVDPAKRLATSLGLDQLSNHPTELSEALRAAVTRLEPTHPGLQMQTSGELFALTPDTRQTFETFVSDLTPNPITAQRLRDNPIFQIFAREFSGTNEYMALQRLLALHRDPRFDCIILDTPPSRNTLAFLEAPRVLSEFLDEKVIRWFVVPANRIFSLGVRKAMSILEKLTGEGFMTHLLDFAASLFEVQASFKQTLQEISTVLKSPQVGFLMVSTPNPNTASEGAHFTQTLARYGFLFEGLIINRSFRHLQMPANPQSLSLELRAGYAILASLRAREQRFFAQNQANQTAILPELVRDVHSLEDLLHVALAFDLPTV